MEGKSEGYQRNVGEKRKKNTEKERGTGILVKKWKE
jgi:hypothetical protein